MDIKLIIRNRNPCRIKFFLDALVHFPLDRPVIFRCDPGAETNRNRALAQLIYEKTAAPPTENAAPPQRGGAGCPSLF